MQGWIFAADSPYAVVAGEDGTFEIDDIPPGEFTLKIWHPLPGDPGAERDAGRRAIG